MSPSRFTVGDVGTPLPMRVAANFYVWLFGRKAFYGWNQRLLNLAVRGMGVGVPTDAMIGPGERRFMQRLSKLGAINVFDVGAHVGEFATRLRSSCPQARIWAFEPHPAAFKQLREAAEASGFKAVNLGLSDRSGRLELYDYADRADGTSHASLHADVFESVHHARTTSVEVDVTTIDEFIQSEKVSHLHLLKVDAEGHELAILRGAEGAIQSGAVDIVQFEFNEMNVMSRVFFKDFYDVLPGFTFHHVVVNGLAPMGAYQPRTHELFILQNVVAIRPGLDHLGELL